MTKADKQFDAVRTMRTIRDGLSQRFKGMTLEEQKRYIDSRVNRAQKRGPFPGAEPQTP